MVKMSEFFKGKKVLITGNTGFKGAWLSYILNAMGADVIGYSLKPHTEPNLFDIFGLSRKMKTFFGDIRDLSALTAFMKQEKPEIILHLAAQALVRDSYDNPVYTFETNVIGTANVLEAAKVADCARSIVIITTDKVYENKEWAWPYRECDELGGHDPYSASKACAELVSRCYARSFFSHDALGVRHRTLIATARAGNVIGGGDWSKDRLVPDIVRSVFLHKEDVELRCPLSVRPWQHVMEPLFGYLMLAKGLYYGEKSLTGPWNFAPAHDSFVTVETIVSSGLTLLGGVIGYKVKECEDKPESKLLTLDCRKSMTELGWKNLLSLDETLSWTFDWYREYYSGGDCVALADRQISHFIDRWDDA